MHMGYEKKYARTREILNEYRKKWSGLFGLFVLAIFVVLALFADIVAPYDPMKLESWNIAKDFSPPAWIRIFKPKISNSDVFGLLGTDEIGRDIFSQIVYGGRTTLIVGFFAGILTSSIGLIFGVIAGYYGGKVDNAMMRVVDLFMMIPPLVLLIIATAILGPSSWNIIFLIALIWWTPVARITRSQVLVLKKKGYVESVRALGAGHFHIIRKHIVPGIMPVLFASTTYRISHAILAEAAISFLGLGDPNQISWGMMLHNALHFKAFLVPAWWYIIPPGLCLALVVIAFFYISSTVEEIINPKLKISPYV